MEEFRSTEILDKEIQEDARKKAEQLLKKAETDGQRIIAETTDRTAKAEKDKAEQYNVRITAFKNDIDASLPLEKDRFLVSFEEKAVANTIADYLTGLSADKRLAVLNHLLERYKPVFAGNALLVRYHGFEREQIESLLRSVFGKKIETSFTALSDSEAAEENAETGMLIETADRAMRCRVTVAEVIEELLDTQRFELANALFCGRLQQ